MSTSDWTRTLAGGDGTTVIGITVHSMTSPSNDRHGILNSSFSGKGQDDALRRTGYAQGDLALPTLTGLSLP